MVRAFLLSLGRRKLSSELFVPREKLFSYCLKQLLVHTLKHGGQNCALYKGTGWECASSEAGTIR